MVLNSSSRWCHLQHVVKSVVQTCLLCGLLVMQAAPLLPPSSPSPSPSPEQQQLYQSASSSDLRITTYQDLLQDRSIHTYSSQNISDYSRIVINIPSNEIIVGARDHLLRLELGSLEPVEVQTWAADSVTVSLCQAKGQSGENCHNFIRVLLLHSGKVFSCGTNAYDPICSWREANNLKDVSEIASGRAKCPYNPHDNSTALMTAQGDLYSATVTDFNARDYAINRIMGPSKYLRTVQYNSLWLNEPDFVSSYEIGEFIYFFYRESAVEYINCGKIVYSRVARVCKSDAGGNFLLEDNWTTFQKARLNCSLPGNYPFYFNHLQNTFYVPEEQLLYAVFTTSPTSIYGTAVCKYKLSALEEAFTGPFKYQENPQMAWAKIPNQAPMQCGTASNVKRSVTSNQTPGANHLVHAQKFQIMDQAVQPTLRRPLVVMERQRYTHAVVDRVTGKHHRHFEVIYVATLEGAVHKLLSLPEVTEPCLLEEIHLSAHGTPATIRSFVLSKEQGALYVGTDTRLIKIPLHRCERFTTRQMCLSAQDPYCGWHDVAESCTTLPKDLPSHHWHQNLTSCPLHAHLQQPVDGGWSDWSDWLACDQTDYPSTGSQCLCRHRTCSNPPSRFGGQPCTEGSVEVTNCTVHGGWSAWSSWSGCSATCGIAVRLRQRACGNPEPRFGGRVCIGPEQDEDYCHTNPRCILTTQAPVLGVWTEWNAWTRCTGACGGGSRLRRRVCTIPPETPSRALRDCIGNDRQYQGCNQHDCDETRRLSDWTPWLHINESKDGGYVEARYRFVCKAKVPSANLVSISRPRKEVRFCSNSGQECKDSRQPSVHLPHAAWTQWSSWTQCNEICGGGSQSRERLCMVPGIGSESHDCTGHGRELLMCNVHSCQGQWSCWSEYSVCSVSCGHGRQWRKRQCQVAAAPGAHYSIPCFGTDREDSVCTVPPCQQPGGWLVWGQWSACSPEGTQQRMRQCGQPVQTFEQCQGSNIETRMCNYNEIQVSLGAVHNLEAERCDECFAVYHLIIVGIIGFILGGVVCVGIFLYCQRQHQEHRRHEGGKFGLGQSPGVKANEYMSPSDLDLLSRLPPVNSDYSSMGSLKRKDSFASLTVKEATLKRDSILRTNPAPMRTNLSLNNMEY